MQTGGGTSQRRLKSLVFSLLYFFMLCMIEDVLLHGTHGILQSGPAPPPLTPPPPWRFLDKYRAGWRSRVSRVNCRLPARAHSLHTQHIHSIFLSSSSSPLSLLFFFSFWSSLLFTIVSSSFSSLSHLYLLCLVALLPSPLPLLLFLFCSPFLLKSLLLLLICGFGSPITLVSSSFSSLSYLYLLCLFHRSSISSSCSLHLLMSLPPLSLFCSPLLLSIPPPTPPLLYVHPFFYTVPTLLATPSPPRVNFCVVLWPGPFPLQIFMVACLNHLQISQDTHWKNPRPNW